MRSRLLAAAWLGAFAASAAAQTHAVEAGRLRVLSAVGEESARGAAAWLERVRERYSQWGFELAEPRRPTVAALLPTVLDLAPFLRDEGRFGRSRGLSLVGRDRNYILLAWSLGGEAWIPLAHEYAHLCDLRRDGPAWFREGLAEVLSRRAAAAEAADRRRYPPSGLAALRLGDWIPYDAFTRASRSSAAFAHPGFYAQSWLAVEWLASRGVPLSRLDPDLMERAAFELGPAGVEEALRRFDAGIAGRGRESFEPPPTASAAPGRAAEAWELPLTLAEVLREIGLRQEAAERLGRLEEAHPEQPAIQAALGALAMDDGRYDEAERRLRRAADDSAAEDRTLHRLALMLLRPVEGEAEQPRAEEAAAWMSRVVARVPGEPSYRLTLAHALMVAERWDAASTELRRLAADRAWRARAEEEQAELARRKQQRLAAIPAPAIDPAPAASFAPRSDEFPEVPRPAPPAPPPAPPNKPRSSGWPPPGAHILAGKISYVDCSGPEKLIIMDHPLFSMKFREPTDRPAKLYFPPLKWKKIPCGASGWRVNLAYRPLRDDSGVRGVALAILF